MDLVNIKAKTTGHRHKVLLLVMLDDGNAVRRLGKKQGRLATIDKQEVAAKVEDKRRFVKSGRGDGGRWRADITDCRLDGAREMNPRQ